MGYRNYLTIIEKKEFDKLKDLTYDEALKKYKDEDWPIEKEPYLDSYKMMKSVKEKTIMELGKYVDFTSQLEQYLHPAFTDKQLNQRFNDDTEFYLADYEILDEIVKIYKNKLKAHYRCILDEENTDGKLVLLIKNVESHLHWLEWIDKTDTPDAEYQLTGSWHYEHEIFNLLYIKKILNTKKYYLFYTGH